MRAIVSALTLPLVLSCVGPEGLVAEGGPSVEHCDPGLSYCDGQVLKQCGDDGLVEQRTRCQAGEVCVQARCEANVVCEAGEITCIAGVLEQCSSTGTELIEVYNCRSDGCAQGACTIPDGSTCPAQRDYCVGNTAYVCDAAGDRLVSTQDCGVEALCVEGTCQDVVCQPGVASCDGEVARTCDALGTGYIQQQVCQAPDSCVDGRCQEIVCEPGRACDGGVAITCNAQGTQVIQQQDCDPDICERGRCVTASCPEGESC